jgi:hypothetical protein
MARLGGRLLRERWEGTERRVPVAVALRAAYLVPLARYAADVGVQPSEALEEAIGLWVRREEQRRDRRVRGEVLQLMRRVESWDPIGDLIALADWQRSFSSESAPAPIDGLCRPSGMSRGNRTAGSSKIVSDAGRDRVINCR